MKTAESKKLFNTAKKIFPGGVNSPVRAFKSVGLQPLFIKKAKGAYIYDEDGNKFIDFIGSWGPMILGHGDNNLIKEIKKTIEDGTSFGACCKQEIALGELIKKFVPSLEKMRMVNSGTEATMSAIRLARAFTGRDKIIKFDGCYHGHGDSFLIKAGSGVATLGLPNSPGVTKYVAKDTLTAVYNDIESVKKLFDKNKNKIAAVIIEPVAGNMGCVKADSEFLKKLRILCNKTKTLLIFDEVMSGFRLARGGAQELYNIKPDLSTFGKIIGGGLPVGAYGGRKDIMDLIAPEGPVYQAGTLSGNPLAMTAGYVILNKIYKDKNFYKKLNDKCEYFYNQLNDVLKKKNLKYKLNTCGSMFTLFFSEKEITDYDSAKSSDTKLFTKYFTYLLNSKVYIAPSQFEACFISESHSIKDLNYVVSVIKKFFNSI